MTSGKAIWTSYNLFITYFQAQEKYTIYQTMFDIFNKNLSQ